jgi:hypothetical protein
MESEPVDFVNGLLGGHSVCILLTPSSETTVDWFVVAS